MSEAIVAVASRQVVQADEVGRYELEYIFGGWRFGVKNLRDCSRASWLGPYTSK